MAPTALFTHWINFGASGFTFIGIFGAFSGVTCAAITFWALAKFGMDLRLSAKHNANWRDVMIAGSIASVINTFGMGYAFNHNSDTLVGYFLGDVTGLFACMFVLMIAFKVARPANKSAG